MIQIIILIIATILNADFKSQRTIKISPLSDTMIEIEKLKKPQGKKISTTNFRQNAFKVFNEKNSINKKWKVKYNFYGIPSIISGDKTKRYYGNIQDISRSFITENRELLGIDTSTIKPILQSSFLTTRHILYQQYYKGIPVEFSYVKIHSNSNGEITQYNARYYPDIDIDINPAISINDIKSIISRDLGTFSISTYTLVIYPDDLNEKYYLAYKVNTEGGTGELNGKWIYYIDSINGNVLLKYDSRQYACTLQQETTGVIKAEVYDISPVPTGIDNGPTSWVVKITTPIANQYVFAGGINTYAITNNNGEYCIDYDQSDIGAKVFMAIIGPYFSITNFSGRLSYYTNGTINWRTVNTPLSITSYPSNNTIFYNIAPSYSISNNEAFAFVGPLFSNFSIGKWDNCGNTIDNDMITIIDSSDNPVSAWFGYNKTNLFGGAIPSQNYKIKLKTDSAGTGNFTISISSYLVIGNVLGKDNSRGSIIWSTNNYLTDGNGASINTFYHLNRIRNFFIKFNQQCSQGGCINLNKRVPVMVDVSGDQATSDCWQANTLLNAFYDMEHDAIFLGKGAYNDALGYYKDFALDGTVIRHEYTHLVVNRIYPIINFGEFGAISEANADYWALSSFWDEGKDITILGNFIGVGEGAKRDLSTITKKMPDDWVGEVHEDGMILSGALYKIRKDPAYNLGYFTPPSPFAGLHKADLYIFGALFYFPDNFENFLEALVDMCKSIEGIGCEESKIRSAFSVHGIGQIPSNDPYEPNNGPEYATDISTFNEISGYINYQGDLDYFALPLTNGPFHIRLYLPQSSTYPGMYHAYSLFLFDKDRNMIADSLPPTSLSLCYYGDVLNNCYTQTPYIDLYYNVDKPQIYYIAVSGSINENFDNGKDYNPTIPYRMVYNISANSTIKANITNRKVDEDEIEFIANVPKFEYTNSINKSWTNGYEFDFCEYDCIKILDNNLRELSTNYITISTATGEPGYNTITPTGDPVIKGKIKFKIGPDGKTFSQRYPACGSIYLKVYAKNHMFNIGRKSNNYISLGISNPIYLTASKNDFLSYNNIISKNNPRMTLKYESLNLSNIKITVYTATGHKVKTIYEGQVLGKISFDWDGTDDSGSKLASGVYYIKAEGAVNKVEKVVIVR